MICKLVLIMKICGVIKGEVRMIKGLMKHLEAIKYYEVAIRIKPDYVELPSSIGMTFKHVCRITAKDLRHFIEG